MGNESQEVVMGDVSLISLVIRGLHSRRDRRSAALVCRVWNEAVRWTSSKLSLRTSSLLTHLAARFPHVLVLDLSWCSNYLEDSDLAQVASSFKHLRGLTVGHSFGLSEKLTTGGLESVASGCAVLEDLSLSHLPNIQDQGIRALCSACKFLTSLSLENCISLTDDALQSLLEATSLRSLSLKGNFRFTTTGLASGLSACGELRRVSLDLGFMEIDLAIKHMASGCPKLEEAELKFRNASLWDLAAVSSLRTLIIHTDQRSVLDKAIVDIVEANEQLTEITYNNPCAPLCESTVIHMIMKRPQLRKLHLNALFLSEFALMNIVHCKKLEHLVLDHYRSSGEGLAQLGLCALQLRHFTLTAAHCIRDVEIQMLVGGKRLEHLNLEGCSGLTSIGFSAIGSCGNLQHLDLSFTQVDDIGLSQIAMGVKNLKSLSLVKCEAISSSEAVALFTTLESLNVDQCPFITDAGLNTIANRCQLLRCLSLEFSRITDVGLLSLTKCSDLREINIPYCRSVQGEGIVNLVQAVKLRLVVLSHRFRDSEVAKVLKENHCFVSFEVDDMALIPFGF